MVNIFSEFEVTFGTVSFLQGSPLPLLQPNMACEFEAKLLYPQGAKRRGACDPLLSSGMPPSSWTSACLLKTLLKHKPVYWNLFWSTRLSTENSSEASTCLLKTLLKRQQLVIYTLFLPNQDRPQGPPLAESAPPCSWVSQSATVSSFLSTRYRHRIQPHLSQIQATWSAAWNTRSGYSTVSRPPPWPPTGCFQHNSRVTFLKQNSSPIHPLLKNLQLPSFHSE